MKRYRRARERRIIASRKEQPQSIDRLRLFRQSSKLKDGSRRPRIGDPRGVVRGHGKRDANRVEENRHAHSLHPELRDSHSLLVRPLFLPRITAVRQCRSCFTERALASSL